MIPVKTLGKIYQYLCDGPSDLRPLMRGQEARTYGFTLQVVLKSRFNSAENHALLKWS